MCYYTSNYPEDRETPVLEVSFSALQGSSGAPILRANNMAVVGMIVGNRETEIQPAQIVKIERSGKLEEEVKYFLPYGKCLTHAVILDFLREQNVDVEVV